MKKEQQKPDKPLPPPPTTDRIQRDFAPEVAKLLFKYKYDNKYKIFYEILNTIRIMEGTAAFIDLGVDKDDDTLTQKHILLKVELKLVL